MKMQHAAIVGMPGSGCIVWAYHRFVRIPIACSLSADAAEDRIEAWRAALRSSVTAAVRVTPARAELRLADGPDAAGRIVDLARREKACCEFFSFTIEIRSEGATLVVEVPEDAAGLLDDFVLLRDS